jgi:hypothetical protein
MNVWPFQIEIDGDDIVVNDIVITCFGGWGGGHIADSQDDGETASGENTRMDVIYGVSIPMDGKNFSTLSHAEHAALDDCPIPRLLNSRGLTAWHTPVQVTIGDQTIEPIDGIVDLGPGLHASRPGQPHGLDLTVMAASLINGSGLLRTLASTFERRGSYRIIGGALLAGLTESPALPPAA